LPCPDCSNDASNFLAKIKLNNYKTKIEFKNMLYLFHNWVNAKKRKQLYNHSHLVKYANLNLIYVINNFISKYNTKGNMKLLTESFQRTFVVKDFLNWFKAYSRAFVKPAIQNVTEIPLAKEEVKEEITVEEKPIPKEEVIKDESVIKEEEVIKEESISEEEVIKEESISEEEAVTEEIVVTPEIVLEQSIITEVKKPKKKKNNKNKK
jgi:hypothetical protein